MIAIIIVACFVESDGSWSVVPVRRRRSQLAYICEEAARARCQGHRAEIFGAQVARALAALAWCTECGVRDLQNAVELAMIPRSVFMTEPPSDSEAATPA